MFGGYQRRTLLRTGTEPGVPPTATQHITHPPTSGAYMSDNCTPRHPFIEVLPGPKGVKRSGSHGDPDSESLGLGKPAKRAKSSKACHTCRQVRSSAHGEVLTTHGYCPLAKNSV